MFEIPSCVAQLMVEAEDTSLSLSWIDAILIVFFGYGFISAHRLGLFGELPRTAGWLAALGVGVRGYSYVATQFEKTAHSSPRISGLYGFLLIGVFFLSLGYVIGMTISRLRKKTVEGGLDLWGGFLLGPVKMVAAYAWLMIALLLLPSVWIRNNLGMKTFTGSLILKYCPDVRARVQSTRGRKDAMDEFIEKKRRKPAEEEMEQTEPPVDADGESTGSENR